MLCLSLSAHSHLVHTVILLTCHAQPFHCCSDLNDSWLPLSRSLTPEDEKRGTAGLAGSAAVTTTTTTIAALQPQLGPLPAAGAIDLVPAPAAVPAATASVPAATAAVPAATAPSVAATEAPALDNVPAALSAPLHAAPAESLHNDPVHAVNGNGYASNGHSNGITNGNGLANAIVLATIGGFVLGAACLGLFYRNRWSDSRNEISKLKALLAERDKEIARLSGLFEQVLKVGFSNAHCLLMCVTGSDCCTAVSLSAVLCKRLKLHCLVQRQCCC